MCGAGLMTGRLVLVVMVYCIGVGLKARFRVSRPHSVCYETSMIWRRDWCVKVRWNTIEAASGGFFLPVPFIWRCGYCSPFLAFASSCIIELIPISSCMSSHDIRNPFSSLSSSPQRSSSLAWNPNN